MALQRDARYPGRWTAASGGHPQGAFKNRTAPGALDGSYIEQDWANDWDGYFGSLLGAAGLTPNGNVDAVGASQYFSALGALLDRVSGVVGTNRKLHMSIGVASASATITADELVLKSALGGGARILNAFSQSINLATTGIGGMLTGSAPVSGYVAIYGAVKDDGTRGVFAVNATSAAVPEVAAAAPAGYTMTALLAVVATDGSGLMKPVEVAGRFHWISPIQIYSSAVQQATLTLRDASLALPFNAKTADISTIMASSAASVTMTSTIAGSSAAAGGLGQKVNSITNGASGGSGLQSQFPNIPIITAQTIYYSVTIASGTLTFSISISGYSI